MTVFKGVYTALITPFKDGKVDDASFQALIERQIESGVHGIIPVGTTGESATVDDAEHWHLFDLAIEAANRRVPVLAGLGPVETLNHVNMQKNSNHPLGTTKNEKLFTKFCRVSLCKVGIACYEVKISSSCPCSFEKDSAWQSDQQWSIDSSGQNQSGE